MSNYQVFIKNSAKSDLKKLKQSNLKDSFLAIYQTLQDNPYELSQSFEKLQPKKEGRYSRRVNHQHRVVYRVNEDLKQVEIYSAWSHYE